MSNEVMNFVSNSELEKYLKERKEAQTEEEIKKIMGRIYGCIAEYSRLIHAFKYSIPPTINDDGSKTLHPDARVQLALIFSETEAAYLPVYTSVEESKNRGNGELFPELKQFPFEGYYDIVFSENSILQGIVINPYTDNLVLSKSKIEHLMNIKKKHQEEKNANKQVNQSVPKVSDVEPIKKDLIIDSDLKILQCAEMPVNAMNAAINFAREKVEIDALWVFDKKFFKENDSTEYTAQLFVVQDNQSGVAKENLYQELKMVVNSFCAFSEIHVEALENQRNNYVRENGLLPFYQKVNVCEIQKITEEKVIEEKVLTNDIPHETSINTSNTEVIEAGWDAIEKEFLRLYPEQTDPKHYGALIKWKFGGPDPLDGISIYDAGDYWHFVTFGLSELYEKESENKEVSGFGLEFTYKLKKGCYEDEEAEIKAVCILLQQIAKIIVVNKEMIKAYEYLYTGQTDGVNFDGESKITGFITVPDSVANTIMTPNGRVEFVELIGVTDNELKAIMNKETNVKELYQKLGTDVTDYRREEV